MTPSKTSRRFGGAGAGSGLTERLARTSALHPWRTICIWTALIVLAVVAVGSLLGSGLTSDIKFRADKPDSLVGQELLRKRLTGPRASHRLRRGALGNRHGRRPRVQGLHRRPRRQDCSPAWVRR